MLRPYHPLNLVLEVVIRRWMAKIFLR